MEIQILVLHVGTWLSESKRNVGFRAPRVVVSTGLLSYEPNDRGVLTTAYEFAVTRKRWIIPTDGDCMKHWTISPQLVCIMEEKR